jgi:serine/threonine protein kinase
MAEGMGNDPAAVALFQREARAVAQLAHRNIVTLYDVGEQAGKSFISMELVDGTTVEKMLQKEGKLSTPKTAAIIEQVLAALEFAHGKKTIHRDIKPANIMVTRDGAVKVMDFGLAKRVEGPDKTTLIAGSPPYMAPEQFVGKNMDGRTDLFAVGVSLYEMLTGQLPFPGLARFDPPKPMRALAPDIPVALDAVVMRALNFDKEKRFPSAADMAVPLRHLLASSGPVLLGSAPVAGAPSPAAETASSSPPAGSAPDEARPAVEPLPLGGAKPREEELFLEELKPAVETLSFGETKPAVEPLSFGEAKPAVEQVLVDSDPSARPAPGAPAPPPAIVEGLPEPSPRSGRTTPRTPIPVVGPSIGAYRMVRPTEPEEVFTPAPGVRTPQPQRPRRPSGELGSGERRRPTPAPTPRPRLSLSAKSGTGEPSTPRPRTPSAETGRPDGPAPKTPSPGPGTGPKGTILGIGRR